MACSAALPLTHHRAVPLLFLRLCAQGLRMQHHGLQRRLRCHVHAAGQHLPGRAHPAVSWILHACAMADSISSENVLGQACALHAGILAPRTSQPTNKATCMLLWTESQHDPRLEACGVVRLHAAQGIGHH